MGGTLGIGLLGGNHTDVVQELVPETAVQQMQGGVLHAAVVPVHGTPVVLSVLAHQSIGVVGIHIAQEVPAGTGPLRHGVGLALGSAAAAGAGGVDPIGHLGDGRLAVVGGLIALDLGQQQGQLALVHRLPAAFLTVDHGDRLAPVTLTGEDPVAQLEVDLGLADLLLLQPLGDDGDGVLNSQTVQELGVDHDAGLVLGGEGGLLDILAAGDDLDDLAAELLGELPVTVVVSGNGHDGAGAVGGQNVVRDEDGDLLAVDGVDTLHAVQADTGLILVQLGTLQIGLGSGDLLIGADLLGVGQLALLQPVSDQSVLGRQNHVGCAEQGVGTGGKDHDVLTGGGLESDLGTGGAADPVLLLQLDALDEVDLIQIVDQALSIGGDLQHPLALLLADDGGAAALTAAVHDLLVGQDALTGGTPVHRHGGLIGQTLLEQLQEDPLSPLVVSGVGGVHNAVPVEGVTQHLQLLGEVGDVVAGHLGRMDVVLDGKVLGGQTEGVKAHGEQDVITVHALLAGDDVHSGVGTGMADMQTVAGGVGELYQTVELGLVGVTVGAGKGLLLIPLGLPLLFNGGEIVLQIYHAFFYS